MTAAAAEDRDRVGPYRVIKAIGAGGSARIDLARIDRAYGFQRHVVVKRPLEHLRGDAQVAASLRREARIGGRLRHPNLVAILDAGVHDGYDYLVLEYIHGAALRTVMQGDAPGKVRDLPLGVALAIVGNAARGMHEAHELTDDHGSPLGLVHRDVSPGNILLGLDGTVKLADFGIAKETRVSTLSGSMHGTVTYMAPEQCQGHAFDRRADVFSLGVILYELVTGARLFWADNDVASLHRVLSGAVPRPRSIRPEIAPALEDILMMAVAHDPARRFATALDLAVAVERHAAGTGEVLGARWIARSVEAVVGARPVPWIAAAVADAGGTSDRVAGAPPDRAASEATPPSGSLVALIAAGADEPEPAFGDGSTDETVGDDPPAADATPASGPRRRRVRRAAIASVAVLGIVAVLAVWLSRGSGAPPSGRGTSSPPMASTVGPTGETAAPGGSVAAPGGSTTAPTGSIAAPTGSTTAPAASIAAPAGSNTAPAASIAAPAGSTAGTPARAPRKHHRAAGSPVGPATTAGAGSAAAAVPPPPLETGSVAAPAAATAPPARKVEWKPTLLLPTDGSNGPPHK